MWTSVRDVAILENEIPSKYLIHSSFLLLSVYTNLIKSLPIFNRGTLQGPAGIKSAASNYAHAIYATSNFLPVGKIFAMLEYRCVSRKPVHGVTTTHKLRTAQVVLQCNTLETDQAKRKMIEFSMAHTIKTKTSALALNILKRF